MTHPFEVRIELTVDATPDQVWDAIASGPGVDSWFLGHTEIDSENKTSTLDVFGTGNPVASVITLWEPGHRYAAQETQETQERNRDRAFHAGEWLIEAHEGGGAVVRYVHSGLIGGETWEAEYNGLGVGDRGYLARLVVYLAHFAPRTVTRSIYLPGPATVDPWAAMTAAVGTGTDAADGQPARLTVPGIEPVEGIVEFVVLRNFVGMRTDDAMYALIHGYDNRVFANAHYFDDRDRSTEVEAWQAWLETFA
jgi:hypothetical protein